MQFLVATTCNGCIAGVFDGEKIKNNEKRFTMRE